MREIIESIISKNYNTAKELIHEAMNEKIGILLEEKLQEYAPTLFEGTATPTETPDKYDDIISRTDRYLPSGKANLNHDDAKNEVAIQAAQQDPNSNISRRRASAQKEYEGKTNGTSVGGKLQSPAKKAPPPGAGAEGEI